MNAASRTAASRRRAIVGLTSAMTLAAAGLALASPSSADDAGQAQQSANERGVVTSVRATTSAPIARPASSDDASAARGYAKRYAERFGVGAGSVRLDKLVEVPGGTIARFQQYLDDKPVLGGQLSVQLDSAGALYGVNGRLSPTRARTGTAKVAARTAASKATDLLTRGAKAPASAPKAATRLSWYDAALYANRPSTGDLTLAYRVDLTPTSFDTDGGTVIVDATSGKTLLTQSDRRDALKRSICDANNTRVADSAYCQRPVRTEGQAATGNTDVDSAYNQFGSSSSYYSSRFGYDLTTKIGGAVGSPTLRAITRACITGEQCPGSQNAFWNGYGMVFGQGFTTADDVVTHELAHGVTEHTNGLNYSYESGAINESMSDVFGEFEDLADGTGNDSSAARWKLGEDLPSSIGVIRDMKNPPAYNQPDRTGSSLYYRGSADNGGVHYNSGVGNKAAYLITDGGSFNGQTITGLGQAKAEQLYWRTQAALTSSADYAELGAQLNTSCAAMASQGTAGITTTNCAQVKKVVTATQM
ncbi:hypothetical protein GCM10011519_28190 [Marmoricola endophyticus]|uniref:Neutral metalloproteinase n=1 Tax=Marmoricola endophyticus TaxID=2040280 RepID=A0A917F731_9ACTN|nr:M4 family metallopeptidase [Marmoricola endophyticus]GGF52601.1 hypothetical protein GCM10011519_28190 [Marmoricola endophyticus]